MLQNRNIGYINREQYYSIILIFPPLVFSFFEYFCRMGQVNGNFVYFYFWGDWNHCSWNMYTNIPHPPTTQVRKNSRGNVNWDTLRVYCLKISRRNRWKKDKRSTIYFKHGLLYPCNNANNTTYFSSTELIVYLILKTGWRSCYEINIMNEVYSE